MTIGFGLLLGLLLRVLVATLDPLIVAGPLLGSAIYVLADLIWPLPARPSTADLAAFFDGTGVVVVALGLLGSARPGWRMWLGVLAVTLPPLSAVARLALESRQRR